MHSKTASVISLFVCVLSLSQAVIFANEKAVATGGGYLPWKFGKCLVPAVQQDFQTDKFFNGHWYEQSSFGNFLFQADGICPTIQYKITAAGDILELDYHFVQSVMKYISILGHSYTQFIRNGEGYLPMTYTALGGLLTFKVPTFIVGTDYENWAVVYTCKQQLFLKSEMSWILTRARNSTDEQKPILEILKKNHLNFDDYKKAVNVGCGPDEPHL